RQGFPGGAVDQPVTDAGVEVRLQDSGFQLFLQFLGDDSFNPVDETVDRAKLEGGEDFRARDGNSRGAEVGCDLAKEANGANLLALQIINDVDVLTRADRVRKAHTRRGGHHI